MLATQTISNDFGAPQSYQIMSLSGKHLSVTGDTGSLGISRSSSTSSIHGAKDSGQIKPKITKSRNGCITCKAKRLKCDETKPTCLQCKKRNVECGGYRKNFKWKSFDETSFSGEGSSKGRDVQPSAENSLLTASPVPRSPSTPTSRASTIPDLVSVSQSAIPSLKVPQRPRGFSQSSQFSYYDPLDEQEHVEMPGLLDQPYHPENSGGYGALGAYSPFDDETSFDLASAEVEAMMAHDLHAPITQADFYPSIVSTGYGHGNPQATSDMSLSFQPAPLLDSTISQAPTQVYRQRQMIAPSISAQHIGQQVEWPLESSEHTELDAQVLQQAISDLMAQQQEGARRGMDDPSISRSRSFHG